MALAATTGLSLEQRVSALEAEVAKLKCALSVNGPDASAIAWERVRGIFANDPDFEEANRIGRQWRESFRPKQRKRTKKSSKRKR